jgi:hypothetical protein
VKPFQSQTTSKHTRQIGKNPNLYIWNICFVNHL